MKAMKKLLLSSLTLAVLSAGSAWAADMPVKAPVLKAPPPAPFTWDSVYVGGEIGYGSGNTDWNQTRSFFGFPGPVPAFALDRARIQPNGGLAGGDLGFLRQTGTWVWGLEFNWDAADINGTRAHVLNPAFVGRTQIDWMATLAARVGFTAWERGLFYAKGGFAIADENHQVLVAGAGVTNKIDDTRYGFVVGVGYEHAFSNSLSAKVEYNYLGLGNKTSEFRYVGAPVGLVEDWRVRQEIQTIKVGLNWHFLSLAPVFSKY
jgi:outer membrane immunogenic protein